MKQLLGKMAAVALAVTMVGATQAGGRGSFGGSGHSMGSSFGHSMGSFSSSHANFSTPRFNNLGTQGNSFKVNGTSFQGNSFKVNGTSLQGNSSHHNVSHFQNGMGSKSGSFGSHNMTKFNRSMSLNSAKSYHMGHGSKFSHGWFYKGHNHNHWSYRCYWPRYGCNCYYDPGCSSWYYWCEPQNCYYPISYASEAPPTPEGGQVVSQGQTEETPPPLPE